VNAWNWRPTLELLLNEDLIDGGRHELLGAHGCGAGVGEELDSLAPFDPQAYVEWLLAA